MDPYRLVKLSALSKHSAETDERSHLPAMLMGAGAGIGASGGAALGAWRGYGQGGAAATRALQDAVDQTAAHAKGVRQLTWDAYKNNAGRPDALKKALTAVNEEGFNRRQTALEATKRLANKEGVAAASQKGAWRGALKGGAIGAGVLGLGAYAHHRLGRTADGE